MVCAANLPAADSDTGEVLRSRVRALGDEHYSLKRYKVLRQGRYKCVVSGVLCNACTRAIVEGLKRVKGIKDAEFDFEDGLLVLTVEKGAQVRTGKVVRALAHAARRVNLGSRFKITDIRYIP